MKKKLILFFDGSCPVCTKEIKLLKKYDKKEEIQFEDITLTDFPNRFGYIDLPNAEAILHGQLPDGSIITGMDVTFLAWEIVHRNTWMRALKLPIIRTMTDWVYFIFAKHRKAISALIFRKQHG